MLDPDYGRIFTIARCVAWQEGFALCLHGTATRDLDLLAVPWVAKGNLDAEQLVARIADATGLKVNGPPTEKPHGRKAWTLVFPGFADPRWVDLSIMPAAKG